MTVESAMQFEPIPISGSPDVLSGMSDDYVSDALANPQELLSQLEALDAEESFPEYIRQAWPIIEPSVKLVWGWHIDVICDHLAAVDNWEIQRLLINIPPRHMKSLLVSVLWPSWRWIREPSLRWLCSSYAQDLSTRDSVRCRRLIQSTWYQRNWGDRFCLVGDQNQKTRFENDKTGVRIATSVGGVSTGEGGDVLIVDDPHNIKEAESPAKRGEVLLWWDEVMSTRINNPKRYAKVIVMQRSHDDDLAGHVLEKEAGYVHLCLPARYEPDNLRTKTPLAFKDPRTKEGEPLWPEMYDDEALTGLENELGSYAAAAQLQQSPHPRGGGMFKVDKFVLVKSAPASSVASVRYWDKAATQGGTGARSAGVRMDLLADGSYMISDVVSGRWSYGLRETYIKLTAEKDGQDIDIWIEQEPGSGGKESAESTIKNLAGWKVFADRVTGSKESRAQPYSAQVEIGNVKVLDGQPWTAKFIAEHESFPVGKTKDMVDAAAGAFNKLASGGSAGTW